MPRKKGHPVESVELTISIRADRATGERIRRVLPSARLRAGTCELKLVGEKPSEVVALAEDVMEKLRGVVPQKDFKNVERSQPQK